MQFACGGKLVASYQDMSPGAKVGAVIAFIGMGVFFLSVASGMLGGNPEGIFPMAIAGWGVAFVGIVVSAMSQMFAKHRRATRWDGPRRPILPPQPRAERRKQCPGCGAPRQGNESQCEYCGARV